MKTSVYVAVAAIAATAGFLIYRFAVQPHATMQAAQPPVAAQPTGNDEAVATPAEEDQIPAKLPDFTLGDLEGKPRSILSWPGKSMIVNFWATWCAPCRREIPLLRELQKESRNLTGARHYLERRKLQKLDQTRNLKLRMKTQLFSMTKRTTWLVGLRENCRMRMHPDPCRRG
jgi:thiol-disulfide isomerase/thioredoxin